jgi:hypothetical protein
LQTSQSIESHPEATKFCGVDRRNIKNGVDKKIALDISWNVF